MLQGDKTGPQGQGAGMCRGRGSCGRKGASGTGTQSGEKKGRGQGSCGKGRGPDRSPKGGAPPELKSNP